MPDSADTSKRWLILSEVREAFLVFVFGCPILLINPIFWCPIAVFWIIFVHGEREASSIALLEIELVIAALLSLIFAIASLVSKAHKVAHEGKESS